jgi:hypothetical protein
MMTLDELKELTDELLRFGEKRRRFGRVPSGRVTPTVDTEEPRGTQADFGAHSAYIFQGNCVAALIRL